MAGIGMSANTAENGDRIQWAVLLCEADVGAGTSEHNR
jgi:hypothetical protein